MLRTAVALIILAALRDGGGGDAGNDFASASPVSGFTVYSGSLPPGDVDYYQFTAPVGTINVMVDPPSSLILGVSIIDPAGVERAFKAYMAPEQDTIVATADVAGEWRLRFEVLTPTSDTAAYRFRANPYSAGGSSHSGSEGCGLIGLSAVIPALLCRLRRSVVRHGPES